MKIQTLTPVMVEEIPSADDIQSSFLYISHKYGTAVHHCACGCGEEVITPLSPEGWTLHFNGRFSLTPSIGNFQFPCGSHYFITNEKVCWCTDDFGSTKSIGRTKKKNTKLKKKKRKKGFWERFFRSSDNKAQ